ncbi:MAG: sensor histidine kinase, partial [Spirochaetota bacterium]
RMLGYRPEDFHHYTDFTRLLHGDDYDSTMRAMEDHLAGRADEYDCEYRIRAADGSYRWIHDSGTITARHPDGAPRTVTGLVRDVDRQRRTEEEARRSEDWFRKVVENANDVVYALDLDGIFTYVSPAWTPIVGHAPDEVVGHSFEEFVHEEDVPACRAFLEKVTREGVANAGVEYRVLHKNGSIRVHSSNAAPLRGDDEKVTGYLGIARDITERVQARERIDALLQEKDLLLREVHHRVKNNLTTVAGLLALQAETVSTEETAQALVEAQGRVQAMLQIYQTLFQSTNYDEVPLATFLQTLAGSVAATHGAAADGIDLEMEFDDIVVPTDLSVPIGIVVNELLSNVYKYAFPEGRGGQVRVTARRVGGEIELAVWDDGIGLPDGLTPENSTGFGLQLVWAEARQLGATLESQTGPGTRIILRFPAPSRL